MTTPPPSHPRKLAADLSRLLWREGLHATYDLAKLDLARALRSTPPPQWTCDIVYETYLLLRERLDVALAKGERMHGQHPAQDP